MSLFKAREWWGVTVGNNENFDQGCLCVANIDNATDRLDKIVIGSYHGYLRIYQPRSTKNEGSEHSGFQASDVLCEMHLSLPILQVEAGKFASGTKNIHLAVLHPQKLSVYAVKGSHGAAEHGNQYQMQLVYDHNLQRTSFNFCYGSFGGVKGRDFLCVQSMDGTLSFYEQESFAFSRFLPGALLPGPIRYITKTDSFVTVSSSCHLESYKYQVLAVATDSKSDDQQQNVKSGKRVAHDWNFNLGEVALDLYVTEFSGAPLRVCVLGTRTLFAFSETGKLLSMKKLDYNPSCFYPYTSLHDNTINCIVGTHTNTLMIYEDITLKWAAQLTYVPVQVTTAHFSGLKGVLVSVDELGHLQCSYLGTDPAMFTAPSAEVREIDYAEQDRELAQLQSVIKHKQQNTTIPMPNRKSTDDLQVTTDVPYSLDSASTAVNTEVKDEEPIPSITVKIILKPRMHITDVKVNIHVSHPLSSSEKLINYAAMDPSQSYEAKVSFYMMYESLPTNMMAEIVTSYVNGSGAPKVCSTTVKLPLKLCMKPVQPVKDAMYKITIDTKQQLVCLKELFTDMVDESLGASSNAVALQVYGGPAVTILASKTSLRYRLQCDAFEGLWPVLNELVVRLRSHQSFRSSTAEILFNGSLPLQEYFEVLDKHFELRAHAEHFNTLLSNKAGQFRAIQRRLLTRFKDKTPAPLDNMDSLLDGTYRQILAIVSNADENNRQLDIASNHLECATRLLNLLVKLWTQMPDKQYEILQAAITPIVCSNGDHGWEELVDASVTHLLRTCLAKSSKDTTINPSPLAMLKDTIKLKKHIALLCDRLYKGNSLVIEGMDMTEDKPSSSQKQHQPPHYQKSTPNHAGGGGSASSLLTSISEADHKSASYDDDGDVPIGSKYGENKSPRGQTKLKPLAPLGGGPSSSSLGGGLAPLGATNGGLPPLSGISGNKGLTSPPPLQTPPLSNGVGGGMKDDLSSMVSSRTPAGEQVYTKSTVPDLDASDDDDDVGTLDRENTVVDRGDEGVVYGL